MSIVILVGGQSTEGNYEHRYLVQAFLQKFGDQVQQIITAEPEQRSIMTKIKRTLKRGQYRERVARAFYNKPYGPADDGLGRALFGNNRLEQMPGDDRKISVPSHNGPECDALLEKIKPDVIVVYGTRIIRSHIFQRARKATLNMHTGLSPFYRGDSTLFWPIYYNEPDRLGVTVHKLVTEVDGGDIVFTGKIDYTRGDTETELFAKGVQTGTKLYLQAVQNVLDNTIIYHQQDLSLGREFRWVNRTIAAERQVLATLECWAEKDQ